MIIPNWSCLLENKYIELENFQVQDMHSEQCLGAEQKDSIFVNFCLFVWFVVLRRCQQLWSCQNGQLT